MSDPSCWCKAGIEYRDEQASSVCSTVTYGGFSDWAGMPISSGIHTLQPVSYTHLVKEDRFYCYKPDFHY